jgi:hypothetical protein
MLVATDGPHKTGSGTFIKLGLIQTLGIRDTGTPFSKTVLSTYW